MTWKIEFERAAAREFRKLDHQAQRRIIDFFHQKILPSEDPRARGKALSGMQNEFLPYRIGPYRVVAAIQDERMVILPSRPEENRYQPARPC